MTAEPAFAPITLQLPGGKGRFVLEYPLTEETDVPQNALFKQPEFTRYLPMIDPNPSLEATRTRRLSQTVDPNTKVFSIRSCSTGDFEGSLGLYRMDHPNHAAEAGLVVFANRHRSGVATEALFLLLEHAFGTHENGGMGFNRITFVTNAANAAMRGWLDSAAGAALEAVSREAWFDVKAEQYHDSVTYAILKSEWEGKCKDILYTKLCNYLTSA
ncbi:acyl-CoA N-acyltransferase [Chytriomyces sp. MP71]|nr:acyl-CoA N-acyltransferase [Chytriomyces sp. MP71]